VLENPCGMHSMDTVFNTGNLQDSILAGNKETLFGRQNQQRSTMQEGKTRHRNILNRPSAPIIRGCKSETETSHTRLQDNKENE